MGTCCGSESLTDEKINELITIEKLSSHKTNGKQYYEVQTKDLDLYESDQEDEDDGDGLITLPIPINNYDELNHTQN